MHKDGTSLSPSPERTFSQRTPERVSNQMPAPRAGAPKQMRVPQSAQVPLSGQFPCWALGEGGEMLLRCSSVALSLLVFKASSLEASQVQVLKVREARCGVLTLRSPGRSSRFWFLPTLGHHPGNGVYGKIVSQPLLPPLTWAVAHSPDVSEPFGQFSGYFSEEVVPYVIVGCCVHGS